jgi:hypothetical protein
MNTQDRRNLGMPQDQDRPSEVVGPDAPVPGDEELILDDRAEKRPAEVVEDKLSGLLKSHGVRISQLRHRSTTVSRS